MNVINFRSSCVVVKYRTIIVVWVEYCTGRGVASVINFLSLNCAGNCGTRYSLRWGWSVVCLRRVGAWVSAEGIKIKIICHYYVNNAMEQSRSWEANSSSVSQEIPHIIWNPKAHSRVYQSLQLLPILGHVNPLHTQQTDFSTILCNIFSPFCLRYFQVVTFLQLYPPRALMHLFPATYMPHVPPFSFLIWSPE